MWGPGQGAHSTGQYIGIMLSDAFLHPGFSAGLTVNKQLLMSLLWVGHPLIVKRHLQHSWSQAHGRTPIISLFGRPGLQNKTLISESKTQNKEPMK